jgi:epoxyqueuosine reductase
VIDLLREKARELGADEVAAAPVERWDDPPPFDASKVQVYPHSGYRPTELMPSARSFVMVGVGLLDGVMDVTTSGCETTGVQGNFAYVFMNRRLHDITYGIAHWLESLGFRSAPLGYNIGSRYDPRADDDDTITAPAFGVFSMKRAAVLAGLGRKARNGLVANPQLGTRMRLGGVLTTAPLEGNPLLEGDPCPPACDICMRVCPTTAISRDGRVAHLRCFSDSGRRGTTFEELKTAFKERYPLDRPGVDYTTNDNLSIDGGDNRFCRITCVALCPLGEHRIPDVVRRTKDFEKPIVQVPLSGFPRDGAFPEAPVGYPHHDKD